jgi:hypothetical protein
MSAMAPRAWPRAIGQEASRSTIGAPRKMTPIVAQKPSASMAQGDYAEGSEDHAGDADDLEDSGPGPQGRISGHVCLLSLVVWSCGRMV